MGQISLQVPQSGQPFASEGAKVAADITTLQTVINGNIDATNLSAVAAQSAGVNQSGQTVKGASIIGTSQSTSSTTYTTLATPDQVAGIVLPANGLLMVWYQATWQNSVASAGSAAIFLNAVQLNNGSATGPTPTSATGVTGVATPTLLFTASTGLSTFNGSSSYSGDSTTGQLFGNGQVAPSIFAAAGTYTVSIQFKASSGTVTVSNRRLYVEAISFA